MVIIVFLISIFIYLFRLHSREAEHTDLVGDVAPVPLRSLLGQTITEHCPHSDDPTGKEEKKYIKEKVGKNCEKLTEKVDATKQTK